MSDLLVHINLNKNTKIKVLICLKTDLLKINISEIHILFCAENIQ